MGNFGKKFFNIYKIDVILHYFNKNKEQELWDHTNNIIYRTKKKIL